MIKQANIAQLLKLYRDLPGSTYVQAVCSLISYAGSMAKIFLPLYLHDLYTLEYAWIGALMSAYGAGSLLGAYLGGFLSDRFRNDRLGIAAMAASGVLLILLAMKLPLPLFAVILLLAGASDGLFRPVNQRLALEECAEGSRPAAQGLLRVCSNMGVSLGGLLAGFVASLGYRWLYATAAATAFAAAGWMGWSYRRSALREPAAASRKGQVGAQQSASPWRDLPFIQLMACLLVGIIAFDQMTCTVGLFLRETYLLGPQWLGYVFTVNGIMVVIFQLPIAHQLYRWGLVRCAFAGTILVGASYLFLILGRGEALVLVTAVSYSLGELLILPSFLEVLMIRSGGRRRGEYLGIYHALWSGRSLYAPAVGIWLYGAFGGRALWWILAMASVVAAAIQTRAIRSMLSQAAPKYAPASAIPAVGMQARS